MIGYNCDQNIIDCSMVYEVTTLFNCSPKDSWSDSHGYIVCGHLILLLEVAELGVKFEEKLYCVVV